ncbi:hypothetical protein [Streptomyces sp. MB09-02B]|uniref:hypothetical protein n=1 Tax=Streptomyces sp. MB09-02B TaxID=3028667 RepID=UPI0029ADA95F|nr:hypothetical protein [Streptomyces sp. MB09-02B]MDX3645121.1 hypothetical protein [Streptomyces sp. MB09-02B]
MASVRREIPGMNQRSVRPDDADIDFVSSAPADPAIGGDLPGGSRGAPTVSDGEPLSSPELRTQFMLVRALAHTAEAR